MKTRLFSSVVMASLLVGLVGCMATTQGGASAPACPGAAPTVATELSMKARDSFRSILAEVEASQQKVLTVEKHRELRALLPSMNDCDRLAVIKELERAANTQRLVPERDKDGRPIFSSPL